MFVVERRHIEGRSASAIATDLVSAFDRHCGTESTGDGAPERPEVSEARATESTLPPTFRSIL